MHILKIYLFNKFHFSNRTKLYIITVLFFNHFFLIQFNEFLYILFQKICENYSKIFNPINL